MKIFSTTAEDNKRGIMRLQLDGSDLELIEELVDRLNRLAVIEDALDVKGFVSPFIQGNDLPTLTREGAEFLDAIRKGWDADEDIELVRDA